MLKKNKTLINLDLRGNPGYEPALHKKVVLKLLSNLKKENERGYKWVN